MCTPDSGAPLMAVLAVVQYEGKKLCGFAAEVTQTSGAALSLKNNTVFSHSPLWMWNEFLLRLWEAQQTMCLSRRSYTNDLKELEVKLRHT